MIPSSPCCHYAKGFPAALDPLRDLPDPTEPDLVMGLYGLLRTAGVVIRYGEVDVLSGHAAQFLYDHDQPDCTDLSLVPPTETLFKALNATWKEITPSGPVTAFVLLRDWLAAGRLVLARFRQPILIYGYQEAGPDHRLLALKMRDRAAVTMSLSDCDAHYWRYPLDEGNVLVMIEEAPREIPNLSELARTAARRAVRAWHMDSLAGCAAGADAYRKLAADLADPHVSFIDGPAAGWMGASLWRQWTARVSSADFFERIAPRFGGSDRAAFAKAAFYYGQCVEAWQYWRQHLGPTWDHSRNGFGESYPEEYIAHWSNPQRRLAASRWVEKAGEWEGKAAAELVKVLR